jgi:hypothetical protein
MMLDVTGLAVPLALLLMAGEGRAQDKAPIPPPAEQAEAEKMVKDVFKAEYAKRGPAERLALAKLLLAQGLEIKDDPKSQYVMLHEAMDVAAQAGDAGAAFAAVDELAKRFLVDTPGLKSSAVATAAKSARTPEEYKILTGTLLRLMEAALLAEDSESAERLGALASQYAKKSQDLPLTNRVTAKVREITEFKSRYEKFRKARETLAADPEDAAANLTVGQFLCAMKGEWDRGLPLLAKGLDPAFASLAQKDLSNPSEAEGQVAVGDGWWDLSEKQASPLKERLKERAGGWYAKAYEKLSGLSKAKVEKRIAEGRLSALLKGTWMDVNDAKLFNLTAKPGEPMELPTKPGQITTVKMQFPKGGFDGVSARILLDPGKDCTAFLIYEGPNSLAVLLDTPRAFLSNARGTGNGWNPDYKDNWKKEAETVIMVLLTDGEYVIYINGQEKTRVKTSRARIDYLGFEARNSTVQVDRIKLRRAD